MQCLGPAGAASLGPFSRQNSPTRRILLGTGTERPSWSLALPRGRGQSHEAAPRALPESPEPARRKNRIMKLLSCALVALALSGTGCGAESSLSPRELQISGTVRHQDGT